MQREIAVEKEKEAQGCNFKFQRRETDGFKYENCGRYWGIPVTSTVLVMGIPLLAVLILCTSDIVQRQRLVSLYFGLH